MDLSFKDLSDNAHSSVAGVSVDSIEYTSMVNTLNFDKLKWKLTKSSEASWSSDLCDFAEEEYKKFLYLKLRYPKVSLVPNKLVDKFWHEHILDTKSYQDDCNKIFGHFIHHFPYFGIYGEEDQNALQQSFDITVSLYEEHFGAYPSNEVHGNLGNVAARCGEHACHVPTSCACRVPGACK
ncbi:hypothetical protein Q4561_18220 [Alteromonas sp. 1_MG-2023]|uniref:glycine-rich domain-containing protein n=1 Tax=Alteromonas sp. 1_MG-2023 TaxID=3062669 RepID=UPI0026E3C425|nr:hypothetical protein [Alteromonas sp. 1_MG-2023]MDO6569014.1 hypothetical protein [Alteromonas sp. 1_MG-2023]